MQQKRLVIITLNAAFNTTRSDGAHLTKSPFDSSPVDGKIRPPQISNVTNKIG
jgi:hypothetical protein